MTWRRRMAKLVCVQMETNDHNTDGVAWFAYVDGKMTAHEAQRLAEGVYDSEDPDNDDLVAGGPLGADFSCDPEELPNALSQYTKLTRFYVADAV
jgi:hypothetical protein